MAAASVAQMRPVSSSLPDGSGTVNQTDFIAFRNAFNNGPSAAFDYDGDGQVNQNDFIQFRNRFNLTA
jgi:hypothetical protein